jgi:hypothetical protein
VTGGEFSTGGECAGTTHICRGSGFRVTGAGGDVGDAGVGHGICIYLGVHVEACDVSETMYGCCGTAGDTNPVIISLNKNILKVFEKNVFLRVITTFRVTFH